MRCLLIDGGNTRIKWALVDNHHWLENGLVDYQAISVWKPPTDIDQINWLCVSKEEEKLKVLLTNWGIPHTQLLPPFVNGPVKSLYNLQELGADRYCLIAGALQEWNTQPIVILSLGTCLTMDFCVNEVHQGGFITPGLTMRLDAMHQFTGKLPQLTPQAGPWHWPGKNTKEAMHEGVRHGLLAEMTAFIHNVAQQYPNVRVVLCGGDAPSFENVFQKPIFARPQLVLQGLAAITLHHDNTP